MYGLICLLEMNRAVYMLLSWSEIALRFNCLQYMCSSLQVSYHSHDLQLFVLGLTALHTINVKNLTSLIYALCDAVLQLHVLQEDLRITAIYQFQKRYTLPFVMDFLLKLMKYLKIYQQALVSWSVEGCPSIY